MFAYLVLKDNRDNFPLYYVLNNNISTNDFFNSIYRVRFDFYDFRITIYLLPSIFKYHNKIKWFLKTLDLTKNCYI